MSVLTKIPVDIRGPEWIRRLEAAQASADAVQSPAPSAEQAEREGTVRHATGAPRPPSTHQGDPA